MYYTVKVRRQGEEVTETTRYDDFEDAVEAHVDATRKGHESDIWQHNPGSVGPVAALLIGLGVILAIAGALGACLRYVP